MGHTYLVIVTLRSRDRFDERYYCSRRTSRSWYSILKSLDRGSSLRVILHTIIAEYLRDFELQLNFTRRSHPREIRKRPERSSFSPMHSCVFNIMSLYICFKRARYKDNYSDLCSQLPSCTSAYYYSVYDNVFAFMRNLTKVSTAFRVQLLEDSYACA